MAFPDAWLDELIAKNDIVSVVSSYVDLKPKGRRLWGRCPLHGEKTPSFSVSPDKQMFYCFGCHAGGTVIQFVMQMEHLTFREAVQRLAERAGMEMPETANDAAMQRERAYKERLYEACKRAARFYMETLLGDKGLPGRRYLASRGLSADAVKRFGIGYAEEGWDHLRKHLLAEGFTEQELLDAGLLVKNAERGRVYAVSYTHLRAHDTPIYNKRNNLYGLHLQKGKKLDDLVMVEGYTDVISLYEAGVTNAVASLGTALTVQQARLLKRYVPRVYIAYDGDAAGQNATIRGLDILRAEGLDVRVIVFPDNLDPDEFIRKRGKDAFDALKDQALSLNAFKLDSMANGFDLTRENDREKYAMEACSFISGLQPVEQGRYFSRLAKKTGYPVDALVAQAKTGQPAAERSQYRPAAAWNTKKDVQTEEETARERAESMLLHTMLQSREATLAAVEQGALEMFSVPAYQSFSAEIVAAFAQDAEPNCARIMGNMQPEDAERVAAAFREELPKEEPVRMVEDCVRRIRRLDTEEELGRLKIQLADSTKTINEKQEIMQRIQSLNRELRG